MSIAKLCIALLGYKHSEMECYTFILKSIWYGSCIVIIVLEPEYIKFEQRT